MLTRPNRRRVADQPSLDEWMQAAREGCDVSRGKVLEGCRQYLLLVASSELPPMLQPKLGASDLVQETFLDAQRDFHQFDGGSEEEVLAWLRQILRNNLRDACRRYAGAAKRDVVREIPFREAFAVQQSSAALQTTVTPSWLAQIQDRRRALRQALDELPEDYQRVIQLRNLESRSFVRIAELMHRSPDAVRKLWCRAIDALQRRLSSLEI